MADLEAIYRTCAPLAFRRARRLLDDESEAWDVVHEVFERMARHPGSVGRRAQPMTYVYRATVNACINRWRHRDVRRDPENTFVVASLFEGERNIEQAAAARSLLAALWAQLDETDRQIVVMYHVDGLPQSEIADALSIWRRTVGRRLRRIRSLAEGLSDEGSVGRTGGAS